MTRNGVTMLAGDNGGAAIGVAGGAVAGSTRRSRVMVVDDDRIVLELTRARLEGAGYEVITREEGLGTVRAIVAEKPDLLLLDISMPAISGDSIAELAQKSQQASSCAIVFHSGGGLVQLQRKARDAGVLGAIPKTESDALFIAQFDRLFKLAQRRRAET